MVPTHHKTGSRLNKRRRAAFKKRATAVMAAAHKDAAAKLSQLASGSRPNKDTAAASPATASLTSPPSHCTAVQGGASTSSDTVAELAELPSAEKTLTVPFTRRLVRARTLSKSFAPRGSVMPAPRPSILSNHTLSTGAVPSLGTTGAASPTNGFQTKSGALAKVILNRRTAPNHQLARVPTPYPDLSLAGDPTVFPATVFPNRGLARRRELSRFPTPNPGAYAETEVETEVDTDLDSDFGVEIGSNSITDVSVPGAGVAGLLPRNNPSPFPSDYNGELHDDDHQMGAPRPLTADALRVFGITSDRQLATFPTLHLPGAYPAGSFV